MKPSPNAPRWRVTYLLRGSRATWTVRAPCEETAVDAARAWRAGFDLERGLPDESCFEHAFAVPYSTSDAMNDGTSWVSAVIVVAMPAFVVLAWLGLNGAGGWPATLASYGWRLLELVCFVGFFGYVLVGGAGVVYAVVRVLRERREEAREG